MEKRRNNYKSSMKSSLKKLRGLALQNHKHASFKSIKPLGQLDELARATQARLRILHFLFLEKDLIPFNTSFRVWWGIGNLLFCRICKTWGTAMTPCFPPPQQPPAVLMVGLAWLYHYHYLYHYHSFHDDINHLLILCSALLTEFSESLRDMGSCLLEKTALNDHGDETGTLLLLLLPHLITSPFNFISSPILFYSCRKTSPHAWQNSVQTTQTHRWLCHFLIPSLYSFIFILCFSSLFSFQFQRSHIFQTITIPSESLLNELRIVEVSDLFISLSITQSQLFYLLVHHCLSIFKFNFLTAIT